MKSLCPNCQTIQKYKYMEPCEKCGIILRYIDRISDFAAKLIKGDKNGKESEK